MKNFWEAAEVFYLRPVNRTAARQQAVRYTADGKIALKKKLIRLQKHGKDYQQLADFLNRNQTPTLRGQGVWTAAKVKRLLNS